MKSMVAVSQAFLSGTLLMIFVGMAPAAEISPQRSAVKQSTAGKYVIITGNCSRSIRVTASHDDIVAACRQALQLRKTHSYVGVATGKISSPFFIHPAFRNYHQPRSFSVYRLSKQSVRLQATTRDRKEAEKTARGKVGGEAIVIYHFAEK